MIQLTIKVRLYGKLRKLASKFDEHSGKIGLIDIEDSSIEKISDILEFLGIEESEVSHIFHNREYSEKNKKVNEGDRVAIFPKDMALIYKWYFQGRDED